MRSIPAAVLVAGLLVFAGWPADADDAKPAAPTVEQLVRDLGSPSFAARQKAVDLLWKRGRGAAPALEKAATDPNPEVARRARTVLNKFEWHQFPDTPPAVLKEIARFRDGTPQDRKTALNALFDLGPPGRAAVQTLLRRDLPPDVRTPITADLTARVRREVPQLLFDGKTDEAADLLALHAAGTSPEGVADYAAFHLLRGTLPAAIAATEAGRRPGRRGDPTDLVLAHLYRANRDWSKARLAAAAVDKETAGPQTDPDEFHRTSLVEMLLEEEGNWVGLAARPRPGELNLPDALDLTFLRLTGKAEEFDAAAKAVRESAAELFARESVRDLAFALLLNHRAADAADLLAERRQSLGLLAEIHIARMRYKDALALAPARTADAPPDPQEKLESDLRRARVLVLTGRRDEAVQLFTQVAEGLRTFVSDSRDWDGVDASRRALLRSELRVGLRDLACEHAGPFVAGDNPNEADAEPRRGETVFDLLFGTEADAARKIYLVLRAGDALGKERGETMRRVKELFAGTAAAGAVDQAVKLLSDEAASDAAAPQRKVTRLSALALVCRAAGRHAEAEAAFAAAADAATDGPGLAGARSWVFGTSDAARPWVEYGDFLADRGRHAEAAAKYETGWKRFPGQPLLLFLSGKALVKAGDAKEGERRMELSHWIGLGNERVRGKFLEELVRRGEGKAAKRETDLLLRGCWSRDFYFGNVMNQAARAAALNKDWVTAERCVQRSLFVLMRTPQAHYVDTTSYLLIPHEMLVFRARGLLAAGDVGGAMAQARACLDVTPGNVELVAGMVPDLDGRGRAKEAAELFGRAWEAYRKVLADYPDSPWARNALAALGAGCRRELDAALGYAKAAVAADPKTAAFRETLAEVHFRRGERDEAVGVMTRLAEEYPRNRRYQRDLVRYKSGDPTAPARDIEDE